MSASLIAKPLDPSAKAARVSSRSATGRRFPWRSLDYPGRAHRSTNEEAQTMAKNVICLWYDGAAEEAARFYAQTFPNSAVTAVRRAPGDYPAGKQGDVLTVEFTVLGIPCLGLNGGPAFRHSEAFSFQVITEDQGLPLAEQGYRSKWHQSRRANAARRFANVRVSEQSTRLRAHQSGRQHPGVP
jgi:hypothetical protein